MKTSCCTNNGLFHDWIVCIFSYGGDLYDDRKLCIFSSGSDSYYSIGWMIISFCTWAVCTTGMTVCSYVSCAWMVLLSLRTLTHRFTATDSYKHAFGFTICSRDFCRTDYSFGWLLMPEWLVGCASICV